MIQKLNKSKKKKKKEEEEEQVDFWVLPILTARNDN